MWRKNTDLEAYFVAGSSPAGVEVTTRYFAWVHVGNVVNLDSWITFKSSMLFNKTSFFMYLSPMQDFS